MNQYEYVHVRMFRMSVWYSQSISSVNFLLLSAKSIVESRNEIVKINSVQEQT